jgi:hypothetical protein
MATTSAHESWLALLSGVIGHVVFVITFPASTALVIVLHNQFGWFSFLHTRVGNPDEVMATGLGFHPNNAPLLGVVVGLVAASMLGAAMHLRLCRRGERTEADGNRGWGRVAGGVRRWLLIATTWATMPLFLYGLLIIGVNGLLIISGEKVANAVFGVCLMAPLLLVMLEWRRPRWGALPLVVLSSAALGESVYGDLLYYSDTRVQIAVPLFLLLGGGTLVLAASSRSRVRTLMILVAVAAVAFVVASVGAAVR